VKITAKAGLFFALTMLFTLLLGRIQQSCPYIPAWVILPQLAPGLAAWLMLGVFRDQGTILRIPTSRTRIWKFAAALGVPLVLSGLILLLYRWIEKPFETPPLSGTGFLILFSWMMVGVFAEELGWRGYLHPLLATRWHGLLTSLLVGLVWGLWHVGNYQHGLVYMLFFVLSTIAYSLVITWLIHSVGWNVILPWFFHLGVNLGFYVFSAVLTGTAFMIMNGLVWSAAAVFLVVVRRKIYFSSPAEEDIP
jgi:membrane protease YdiL (CAAX protease family)